MILQAIPYIVTIIILHGANDQISRSSIMISILSMNPAIFIGAIVLQSVTVLHLFGYLMHPNTTTTMHSYPVNKRQLWFTNVTCGFIFLLVPLFVMFIALLIPIEFITTLQVGNNIIPTTINTNITSTIGFSSNMMQGWSITDGYLTVTNIRLLLEIFPNGLQEGAIINTLPVMFGFLFRSIVIVTFYYAVFVFAISVAGNAKGYCLANMAIIFAPTGLVFLYNLVAFYYVLGHVIDTSMILTVLSLTNPIRMLGTFTYIDARPILVMVPESRNLVGFQAHIVSYVVIILTLFIASFKLYMIRKPEHTWYTIVFTTAKNIIICLYSVAGALLTGIMLLSIMRSATFMYIGFVIGFVIMYINMNMITPTFKQENTLKRLAIAGCVIIASVFTASTATRIFQESRIPDANDVVSITLNNQNFFRSNSLWFSPITDPYIIEETLRIHSQIVDNRSNLRDTFTTNTINPEWNSAVIQEINYVFADGTTLNRTYTLPLDFVVESGLNDLLMSDSVILSRGMANVLNELDHINALGIRLWRNDLHSVAMWALHSDYTSVDIVNLDNIAHIIPYIKKDIIISTRNENHGRSGLVDMSERESIGERSQNSMRIDIALSSRTIFHGGTQITLEYAENTFRWLMDNGYIY